jgi:hypothetical protein
VSDEKKSALHKVRSFRKKQQSFVARTTLKTNDDEAGVKNNQEEGPRVKIDTSQIKWNKGGAPVIDKVLTEYRNDLTPSQLQNLENTLATLEAQSAATPKIEVKVREDKFNNEPLKKKSSSSGSTALKSPKSTINSGRFFNKLSANYSRSNKTETKPSPFIQNIDLREIEICQQIGRGASSAGVYLCLVDGWACAMKQLKKEHVGALDIRCFEREMDILYQLPPHPHIVRYLFHTSLGTDLCLFMQLYSGTLRQYLDDRRQENQMLPADLVARLALEAATGLQFLHSHGVIHRDIKVTYFFYFYHFFLFWKYYFSNVFFFRREIYL